MSLFLQVLGIVVNISIIFTLLFTARQALLNKKAIYLASTQKIYEEEKLIRTYFIKSFQQIDKIVCELKNREVDPFLVYMKKDYKELREIGAHYEYLGVLLYTKMIPKETIFQFISAPDNFWKKTEEFREIMRTRFRKDFWINFEHLYQTQISSRTEEQKKVVTRNLNNKNKYK